MNRPKAVLSWSGGKDSSLCFHFAKNSKSFDIVALLTTVTEDYQRISMHGVRLDLLRKQADALKLLLYEVMIPKQAPNEIYEAKMTEQLLHLRDREKISKVVFGDLFLEDIRSYRERFMERIQLDCEFPVWGKNTRDLARQFIESGFRAVTCCVDPRKIGSEFCGREYDTKFLSDLPESVDPCGENGEFHTFVYDGPIFQKKIDVKVSEVVERDGFFFADIVSV